MKKVFYYLSLCFCFFSCEKDTVQNIQLEELHGLWRIDNIQVASFKGENSALIDIEQYLKAYDCDDWYIFSEAYIDRRNCMSGGKGSIFYTIKEGHIIIGDITEATDLSLDADTLYLNRDETNFFQSLFRNYDIELVVLRKRYIKN